jgi:D-sedoheptulose 7-phosphate isomerase
MLRTLRASISQHQETVDLLLRDEAVLQQVVRAAESVVAAFRRDQAFYVCGNGGSAADAQHWVAELVGRFNYDRPPLRAEALTVNTSDLTCIANDYGYEHVFSRPLRGKGRKGDVLLGVSTSGNSANVVNAVSVARELGILSIVMTGASGGRLSELADITIRVPSTNVARIQECHGLLGHALCQLVEAELFPKS